MKTGACGLAEMNAGDSHRQELRFKGAEETGAEKGRPFESLPPSSLGEAGSRKSWGRQRGSGLADLSSGAFSVCFRAFPVEISSISTQLNNTFSLLATCSCLYHFSIPFQGFTHPTHTTDLKNNYAQIFVCDSGSAKVDIQIISNISL